MDTNGEIFLLLILEIFFEILRNTSKIFPKYFQMILVDTSIELKDFDRLGCAASAMSCRYGLRNL